MTKLIVIGALAAFGIAVALIVVIPQTQGTGSDIPQVKTIGLPDHGVTLVGPQDPTFGSLVAEDSKLNAGKSMAKASSVFVVNNAAQSIAAVLVKWEILLSDGRMATHSKGQRGTLQTGSDGPTAHLTELIPANGKRLVSLLESSIGPGRGFRMGGGRDPDIARQLSDGVTITVTIDGVLFVDGTFVGPDTEDYFAQLRGEIDASRDLNIEIIQLIDRGVEPSAIMNRLETRAKTLETPETPANVQSEGGEQSVSVETRYSFWKALRQKQYAQTLLLTRRMKGDMAVLEYVRAEIRKPQINLRKL